MGDMYELYGKHVRIYFNLHKKVWSIKDKKTNLVIGHTKIIYLKNCKLVVSEKGRQRVLRDKRKNVHAYVDGIVAPQIHDFRQYNTGSFTYNPYKFKSFVHGNDFAPIKQADNVCLWVTYGNRPKQLYLNEVNL